MFIDTIFVAEYVRFNPDGTVNTMAIFDQVLVQAVPSTFSFTLLCRVSSLTATDVGYHTTRFEIVAPSGAVVNRHDAAFRLGSAEPHGIATTWIGARFDAVVIQRLGLYRARVLVDGTQLAVLAVPVIQRATGS